MVERLPLLSTQRISEQKMTHNIYVTTILAVTCSFLDAFSYIQVYAKMLHESEGI
jgi:hypothetical protein